MRRGRSGSATTVRPTCNSATACPIRWWRTWRSSQHWRTRRLSETLSRSFARALLEGEEDRRGFSPSLFLHEASELVILSAAGAKDLLAHRCEGPAFDEGGEE